MAESKRIYLDQTPAEKAVGLHPYISVAPPEERAKRQYTRIPYTLEGRVPEVGDIIRVWMPDADIPKRAAIVTTDPDENGDFHALSFTDAYAKEGGTQRISLNVSRLNISWEYK